MGNVGNTRYFHDKKSGQRPQEVACPSQLRLYPNNTNGEFELEQFLIQQKIGQKRNHGYDKEH